MVTEGDRPLADGGPDPAPDRLQAEAVLVLGPDLDGAVRMRRFGLRDRRLEPPLKAARCSGVAARACRGRGAWTDQPMRFSASQPRCGCTFARPRYAAIQAATLGPLHTPPSSGGVRTRAVKAESTPSVSRLAGLPFRRRASPSVSGPRAFVVAARQLRHPARHEGQHLRDLQHGAPLRQEPDRLEVPRLGHVPRGPVPRLQLRDGKMPDDPRHGAAPEPRPASLRPPVPLRNPSAEGGDHPDSV
jgi:hypothetical protein